MAPPPTPSSLVRFAWLSIAAALVTIGLKAAAYAVTGSVGLLSDALESGVNLVAAVGALFAVRLAESPADEEHEYGHHKIEYFASAFEGLMILVAAIAIALSAVPRLVAPRPLEHVGLGLAVSCVAALVNLVVGVILVRVGKARRSIVLEADGRHLLTDVWTSAGVVVGVSHVEVTGIERLDPIAALLVGANIVVTAVGVLRRSARGLLDATVAPEERARIVAALDRCCVEGARYHELRARQSGSRTFVSVHILVPGAWTVARGHDLLERIEEAVRATGDDVVVFTHLEPLEDPRAHDDPREGRGSSV
jgi:cation diffusion facilitator family transporter